ncbi:MAG: hypothetical protein EPO20_00870 [Betaproteobacteria bacterium]|nr:MAG: hypothetical protein EPO20_00870 [Betaproteobacteria bacterium]
MPISRRLRRAIALMMLAALAFAQATIALAACQSERGSLLPLIESSDDDCPCAHAPDQLAPRCIAHCTSDLQLAGAATVIARAPADAPVLFVAPTQPKYASSEWQEARPPGGLPARILFQSFLI